MSSAQPALIVIVCPHCGTRYQVPPETIGKGRQVSCAHCGRTWKAEAPKPRREAAKPVAKPVLREVPKPKQPSSDRLFDETEEAELDEAFASAEAPPMQSATAKQPAKPSPKQSEGGIGEAIKHLLPMADLPAEAMRSIAQIKAALGPKLEQAKKANADPAGSPGIAESEEAQSARGKVRQRRLQLARELPGNRMRRIARVAAGSALALTLATAFFLRTDLVRALPDLAGLYEAIGLKVNVVGLDFANVETTRASRANGDTLEMLAKIRPVEAYAVAVPQVIVTLYDHDDRQVYQWGVTPSVSTLSAGDTFEFSAELPNPPENAVKAVLSFGEAPSAEAGGHASVAAPFDGAEPHENSASGAVSSPAEIKHDTAPAGDAHATPTGEPASPSPDQHNEEGPHHG